MRKYLAVGVTVAAFAASTGAAQAQGPAYGKQIKDTFGASYGQILNSVRGDTSIHGVVVFPPASGAKAFWQIHAG